MKQIRMILLAVMLMIGMMLITTEVNARGTGVGTLITNAICQITFSNVSGLAFTNQAEPVTNTVTNAYDMSILASPQTKQTNTAGAMMTWDLGSITNWGNLSDDIVVTVMTDAYSTNAWLPSHFEIWANGGLVASNDNEVRWTNASISPWEVITNLQVRLRVGAGVGQTETNGFMVMVNNGAPLGGDSWPGDGALAPATSDVGNARDYQTRYFSAYVSGPVMTIRKYVTAGQVKPYDTLEYTIRFTNEGGAKAVGVQILDVLPPDTALIPDSAETNNTLITAAVMGYYDAGTWVGNDHTTTLSNTNITMIRWSISTNDTQPGMAGEIKFTVRVR